MVAFGLLTKIQAKLAGVGVILLGIAAAIFRMKSLKNQRDRAEAKADTLKATVHAQRVKERIKKEEEVKLSSRRAEIAKEIEDIKRLGENSEGVKNLLHPNDDWS